MIMMDRENIRKLPLPEAHVDHLGHKVHRFSGFRPFSGLEVDLFLIFKKKSLKNKLFFSDFILKIRPVSTAILTPS